MQRIEKESVMIRKSCFALAAFLLAAPMFAQTPPWTAAGTTAVIDESSVPLYALTPPYLGFSAAAGNGVISAYFNVTDTTATAAPAWTTLEISYFDNHPQSQVSATLFRLDKCNGTVSPICTATSADAAITTCTRCTVGSGSGFDFLLYDYYVTVSIYRSNAALQPRLYGVRLY
jgi:hypothetical protein